MKNKIQQQTSQEEIEKDKADTYQSIVEQNNFFEEFLNPANFHTDTNFDSITPIEIPNNGIKVMVQSNNDVIFVHPLNVRDLNKAKKG